MGRGEDLMGVILCALMGIYIYMCVLINEDLYAYFVRI